MSETGIGPTRADDAISAPGTSAAQRQRALFDPGALRNAIFNGADFSSIASDADGVVQIFNVGAERTPGHVAADVMGKITPADICDAQELIARAQAPSVASGTRITPEFESLVLKALRGAENRCEPTCLRNDGLRQARNGVQRLRAHSRPADRRLIDCDA